MKSYNTLEECIHNKSSIDFIFKQNHLQKIYSYGSLEIMKKFQKKHKCNLYEYVDYTLPIRLFFYIQLHNSKNNFEDIFSHIIKVLKFNKGDFIIIQENDISFRIIHKYLYVNSYENLDNFLFKHNLYNITLYKTQYLPSLYNNDVIITEKYNFEDSILNNINTLLEFKTDTNILTKTITSQYIQDIEFNNSNTLFIKSGMGSGKSTSTVNYIKKNNISSFLILSCRKTLTYTIYDKLKSEEILVDNYITSSKNNIKLSDRLIISPDSICKLDYPLKKFDFIWIDEGVSFMYYIGNHLCISKNTRPEVLYIIEWLLKNCNRLLVTDADLNNNVIQYYLNFRNISYCNYLNYINLSNKNVYKLFDCEKSILKNLEEKIKNNKNLYICCDTLSKTKSMYNYIVDLDLIKIDEILLYNSETDTKLEKQMYDVNKFWSKYKIVIVSPKVVFGVDFNMEYFDYVYGFYKCATLNVREAFQQLHRIRNIKSKKINIFIYEKTDLTLANSLCEIKYKIQTYDLDNLFYKKSKNEIDYIVNCISYTINKLGYKHIEMEKASNYLIIYCIYECNNSLNNFIEIFKNLIPISNYN